MTKEKLISQYQRKVEGYDVLLESIKLKKRKLRNCLTTDEVGEWNDLCSERKMISAQRQCTIQFISDLENELEV